MKRTLLRLSALTVVMSLGTYAVVEAQRSHRTAQAEATAVAEGRWHSRRAGCFRRR